VVRGVFVLATTVWLCGARVLEIESDVWLDYVCSASRRRGCLKGFPPRRTTKMISLELGWELYGVAGVYEAG